MHGWLLRRLREWLLPRPSKRLLINLTEYRREFSSHKFARDEWQCLSVCVFVLTCYLLEQSLVDEVAKRHRHGVEHYHDCSRSTHHNQLKAAMNFRRQISFGCIVGLHEMVSGEKGVNLVCESRIFAVPMMQTVLGQSSLCKILIKTFLIVEC